MAKELAFALINPYSIAKSRTGGIIARIMSRTGLELVAARMYGPSPELVERYAERIRSDDDKNEEIRGILADYVLRAYAPDPVTGRRRRVMLLLFEGEDAIRKVCEVSGPIRPNMEAGETVRDTYGDFIVDAEGAVRYVEPALLMGPDPAAARKTLRIWADYAESDGGVIETAHDVNHEGEVQKTLVLIKPDNFRFPSSRPGNIIDLFSRSGLRIIGAKIHRMSCAEAEEFYGPVRDILRTKLRKKVGERAAELLSADLGIELPEDLVTDLGNRLGPVYGDYQFHQIIHFMTGCWADQCPPEKKTDAGHERCLALVYAGQDAVNKIRYILGPTDPTKAEPGTVRRELGRDIMVNAAHASDSPENAAREMGIIRVGEDHIRKWVDLYYGEKA
jgi:nucleoside diphosphate kinase